MDLETFINLAKRYEDLGWAVQEQLLALMGGASADEQNSNALRMIEEFITTCERRGVVGTANLRMAMEEEEEE